MTRATKPRRAAGASDKAAKGPVAGTVRPSDLEPEENTSNAVSDEAFNRLREQVRSVLAQYRHRALNTRDNNCWELMHSIVAYGVQSQVHVGGPSGPLANSIGWLCYGRPCQGQALVHAESGRVTAAKGPRVQGHHGQFLAILAQAKVMPDYAMQLGGRNFTVADLIESEKLGCQSGTELTFILISLVHYLESDATWRNRAGEVWSIDRLIREEIRAPINGAACGGTHRLMGISFAVRERLKRGEPLNGEFHRAEIYINDYQRYTFRLQNPDGSFSTEWFRSRGNRPDLDRRLQTTGHILEWLVYSASPEMLEDPRLVKAVAYLSGILAANPNRNWSIGPLGHGLHALSLYDERVCKPLDDEGPSTLARRHRSGGGKHAPAE